MGSIGYCSYSLQKNIIVLAIIDLICEIVGTTFGIVLLVSVVRQYIKIKQSVNHHTIDYDENREALLVEVVVAISSLVIHITIYLVQIGLAVLLIFAASRKSFQKCRIWLNVTIALLTVSIIAMIVNYIFGVDEGKPTSSIAPQLFLYLFKGYILWIVYSYMSLLRYNNNIRQNGRAAGQDEEDEWQ